MRWDNPLARKPSASAQINWSNSITKDLVFLSYPGTDLRHDLLSKDSPTLLSNGTWNVTSPLGLAVGNTSNAGGAASYPFPTRITSITTKLTICCGLKPLAWGTTYGWGPTICIPVNAIWSSPYTSMMLHRTDAASTMRFTMATTAANFFECDSDTGMIALTDPFSFYSCTRNGDTVKFYRNGVSYGSKSLGSSAATYFFGTQPMHVFQSEPGNTLQMQGTMGFIGIWSRDLTEMELRTIARSPFDLVRDTKLILGKTPSVAASKPRMLPLLGIG